MLVFVLLIFVTLPIQCLSACLFTHICDHVWTRDGELDCDIPWCKIFFHNDILIGKNGKDMHFAFFDLIPLPW